MTTVVCYTIADSVIAQVGYQPHVFLDLSLYNKSKTLNFLEINKEEIRIQRFGFLL